LESVDNRDVKSLWIPVESTLRAIFEPGLLGGVIKVESDAYRSKVKEKEDRLYTTCESMSCFEKTTAVAIPYFANANRQPGDKLVWIPTSPDLVKSTEP
jgi:DUF1680 family protein